MPPVVVVVGVPVAPPPPVPPAADPPKPGPPKPNPVVFPPAPVVEVSPKPVVVVVVVVTVLPTVDVVELVPTVPPPPVSDSCASSSEPQCVLARATISGAQQGRRVTQRVALASDFSFI